MEETNQKPTQQKNTGMAIIAYLIFFIPLLTDAKNDPFVKYHVKQGLTLLIAGVIVGILSSFLPWSLYRISQLLNLFVFVLMIIGIMNASKGEEKPLPIIGKFADNFKF
ncbi:MAG: hypothetical protein WC697_02275 [Patescibacteria group bacterium]|jgi:uncharacterized membrane protein